MSRKLGLLIAVVLVIVHTLSVWHMAEHGFCKHDHKGKTCDISLAFDNGKSFGSSNKPSMPKLAFSIIRNIPVNDSIAKVASYSQSQPRAPPFLA